MGPPLPRPTETPWPTGLLPGEVRAFHDLVMSWVGFMGLLLYVLLALAITVGVFLVVRD